MKKSSEVKVTWPEHPEAEATIRITGTRARAIITSNGLHGKLPDVVNGRTYDWNRSKDKWMPGSDQKHAQRIKVARRVKDSK